MECQGIDQQLRNWMTERGQQGLQQTGHSGLLSKAWMMQDQQNTCPHGVELLLFASPQQILHIDCVTLSLRVFGGVSGGLGLLLWQLSMKTVKSILMALRVKVATRRQPSTEQLASLICSTYSSYVQEKLSNRSSSGRRLFKPSMQAVKTSQSMMLITSSALSIHRTPQSRSTSIIAYPLTWGTMFFLRKGMREFLPTSSKTVRRALVFLFRRRPF